MRIVRFGKSFRALLLKGKTKLGTVQLYQQAKINGKVAWRKWRKKTLWADVKIEKEKLLEKNATESKFTPVRISLPLSSTKKRVTPNFRCSELGAGKIALHIFLYWLLHVAKKGQREEGKCGTAFRTWREHCTKKGLEVDHIGERWWNVYQSDLALIPGAENRAKQNRARARR